jgi:hypothetical protein
MLQLHSPKRALRDLGRGLGLCALRSNGANICLAGTKRKRNATNTEGLGEDSGSGTLVSLSSSSDARRRKARQPALVEAASRAHLLRKLLEVPSASVSPFAANSRPPEPVSNKAFSAVCSPSSEMGSRGATERCFRHLELVVPMLHAGRVLRQRKPSSLLFHVCALLFPLLAGEHDALSPSPGSSRLRASADALLWTAAADELKAA